MTNEYVKIFRILTEAQIFMVRDDTNFRGKTAVLKNPTFDEYLAFKKNTKYNAIRGIGINNDIYIIDANSGIHDQLAGIVLERLGYDLEKINFDDYITCTFKEDEFNNFSSIEYKENDRLRELKIKRQNTSTNNTNYFDLETEYKDYVEQNCDKENILSFDEWLKERN